MTNCRSIIATVLLLGCVSPTSLTAQVPETCSYDACALRLRHTFFKTQLVQGNEARPVASLGLFAPRVSLFAERSDTAGRYYASFRRRATSGTLLGLAGLVLTTLGLVEYDSDHDTGLVLVIGGGLLGIVGGIQVNRAREQLSQAVWWYNRTLTTAP
jgi:hypothetical protein